MSDFMLIEIDSELYKEFGIYAEYRTIRKVIEMYEEIKQREHDKNIVYKYED